MSDTNPAYSDFGGLLGEPGRIGALDVLYFRREVFRDGVVSREEAEALLTMNSQVRRKCPEWNPFYVEALTDHIVNQVEPKGYVTVDNAQWLIDAVSADGRVEAANELELLIRVLQKSQNSPELLVGYVLKQVARAVLEGEGPLANGRKLTKGVIDEPEVELIRAVLYAYGGEAGISISKAEAEFLFDLNDAISSEDSHPAWRELFVKAIGNYLLAAATYNAPSRAEALAREEWLADTKPDVAGTLTEAVSGFASLFSKAFLDGLFDDSHTQIEKAWKMRNEAAMRAELAAEKLDLDEADWLIEKLQADGVIDANERDLLGFIRRESSEIDPKLQELMKEEAVTA